MLRNEKRGSLFPLVSLLAAAVALAVIITTGQVTPRSLVVGPAGNGTGVAGTASLGESPFSLPLTGLNPANYESCEIGNFGGPTTHALEHHWQVLSRSSSTIDILVGAVTVDATQEGRLVATATDNSGARSVGAIYPAGLGQAIASLTLSVTPGAMYDLTIENLPLEGQTAPLARHYTVGAVQGDVEIGMGSPSLEYQELNFNRWAVNVAALENSAFFVIADVGAGDVPKQADNIRWQIVDAFAPSGPTPVSQGMDAFVGFPTQSVPMTYELRIQANGHSLLTRLGTSFDLGLYVLDCTAPPAGWVPPDTADVEIDVKETSINLNGNGLVTVWILGSADFEVNEVNTSTIAFGPGGAAPSFVGRITDRNGDNLPDLDVRFHQVDIGIDPSTPGATILSLTLTADLTAGGSDTGSDGVRVSNIKGSDDVRVSNNGGKSRGKDGKGTG